MEGNFKELLDLVKKKPELNSLFLEIGKDECIIQLINELVTISPDLRLLNRQELSKENLIKRIERFVESTKKKDLLDDTDEFGNPKEPTQFIPPLVRGQLIKVKFSAVGSELDNIHFAIVWDALPNRDTIQIIPTESMKGTIKETKHRFNIGKIRPLARETAVCLEQVTCISRKRIIQTEFTNKNIPIYISDDQEGRIEEGFRVLLLREESLLEHIISNNFKFFPVFDEPEKQLKHLLRPLKNKHYDKKTLIYQLYNESDEYTIIWKKTSLDRKQRKNLLLNMANVKDTDTKNREILRVEIYNNILKKFQ